MHLPVDSAAYSFFVFMHFFSHFYFAVSPILSIFAPELQNYHIKTIKSNKSKNEKTDKEKHLLSSGSKTKLVLWL